MVQAFLKMDFIALLNTLNDKLAELASRLHIKALILYIAMAVIAALIGLAGLHLAKLLATIGMTGFGYVLGVELLNFLKADVAWFAKWPGWTAAVFGIVFALVFLLLSWKRVLHVIFSLFVVIGYLLVMHYVHDNMLLALGAGILLALLTTFIVKFAFIIFTSLAGGFMLTSLLGAIWTKAAILQLGVNKAAVWVALGISLLFFLIQLLTTRHYDDVTA